jgi:single-strand DNA-binding protein
MMDSVATSGLVATIPKHTITSEGLAITSFRLASSQRRFNKNTNQWENGTTNWFTVSAFRQLALNLASSVNKGDRVVVIGRMRIREWENDGGKSGTIVEISADSVGHDLNWGSATFSRIVRSASLTSATGANDAAGDGAVAADSTGSTGDSASTQATSPFDPDDGRRAAVDGNGWAVPNGSASGRESNVPGADGAELIAG